MSAALPTKNLDQAYFDVDICRNCDQPLHTNFCPECGQKKAARFTWHHVRSETWERIRWFEFGLVKGAFNLVKGPGRVAREYVLGERKKHVHPLKLLLIAIGLLLFVMSKTRFMTSSNATLSKAAEWISAYSEWSFSIGIVAILFTALLLFRRRLGYNVTEHLVLAIYTHFLLICANIINQLCLMLFYSPQSFALYKQYSSYYMDTIGAFLVVLAFSQFYLLDLRRDWWRLLLVALVFIAIKRTLIYLYAKALIKIALAQMA